MAYVVAYTGSISKALGGQKPDAVLIAFRLPRAAKDVAPTATARVPKADKSKSADQEAAKMRVAELVKRTVQAAAQPGVMAAFETVLKSRRGMVLAFHTSVRSAEAFCRWPGMEKARIAFVPVFDAAPKAGG